MSQIQGSGWFAQLAGSVNCNDDGKIYVNPSGLDINDGSFFFPVKTLTKAFTLVSASRPVVVMAPGSYVEAAAVAWPNVSGVALVGAGCNVTSISVTGYAASVINVIPGAKSSTFTGLIQGVEIDHSGLTAALTYGQIGIQFSNATVTKKIQFNIKNCGWSWEEDTDQSVKVVHTDTGNAVRIYISGDGSQQEIGAMYFAVGNNADRLHCENLWLMCPITTVGADQLRVRLLKCIVQEHSVSVAVACNSSLVTVTLLDCFQWTDYDDTVAEIFEQAEAANVTGTTAVIVD